MMNLSLRVYTKPSSGAHTPFIPVLERQRQADLYEFEASLVYMSSSQDSEGHTENPSLENKQTQKQKTKKKKTKQKEERRKTVSTKSVHNFFPYVFLMKYASQDPSSHSSKQLSFCIIIYTGLAMEQLMSPSERVEIHLVGHTDANKHC